MVKEYVQCLGNVHTFETPFDESLVLLKENNAKLMSLRDLAYGRIKTGEYSNLSQRGSYTKESPIYSKDVNLLVLDSPLQDIGLAKQAVLANRNGTYFQLENSELFKKYLNQAEKDRKKEPEKRKVLVLPSDENFDISRTQNFDFARGLFKDRAESYLKFLEDSKYRINSIRFYTVSKKTINKSDKPIITEMWILGLDSDSRSVLYGDGRNLNYNNFVRGVELLRSREATEQVKNFAKLNYSKKDVRNAIFEYNKLLNILQPNQIEKIGGLIEKLKQ